MNDINIFPIDYCDKKCTGLWLRCKYKKTAIFDMIAIFNTGKIHYIRWIKKDLIKYDTLKGIDNALLDYDFYFSSSAKTSIMHWCNINEEKEYNNYLKIFCQ